MINQKPVFLMKHVPVVLAVLLAFLSCEKGSLAPYTLSVVDQKPFEATIVGNLKDWAQQNDPIMVFTANISEFPDMPKGYTISITEKNIQDGKFRIPLNFVIPGRTYYYTTTLTRNGRDYSSELMLFDTPTLPEGPVDMGTSVKWASTNLMARSPFNYGGIYVWGDITYRSSFYWKSYKWGMPDALTKYSQADGKTVLDLEDDAAYAALGGKWRMPSEEEFQELLQNCDLQYFHFSGANGWLFTSKITGNAIFFPLDSENIYQSIWARTFHCWSRTLAPGSGEGNPYENATEFACLQGNAPVISTRARCEGAAIRPVYVN